MAFSLQRRWLQLYLDSGRRFRELELLSIGFKRDPHGPIRLTNAPGFLFEKPFPRMFLDSNWIWIFQALPNNKCVIIPLFDLTSGVGYKCQAALTLEFSVIDLRTWPIELGKDTRITDGSLQTEAPNRSPITSIPMESWVAASPLLCVTVDPPMCWF